MAGYIYYIGLTVIAQHIAQHSIADVSVVAHVMVTVIVMSSSFVEI